MPNQHVADQVLQRLRSLTSYDALIELLTTLGFDYDGHEVSIADWPPVLRAAVQELRVAARHGSFVVFHARIPESGMLGVERQVTARLLRLEPHALLVFTDPSCRLWHVVHVRFDPQAERRRQLRRFVVDVRDSGRRAERLRTTAERLSLLHIEPGEHLSAPDLQKKCDEAFRISEVTKGFLRAFVQVVDGLTERLKAANPGLLPTDQDALRQAQLLMDRLVFLYFVQKKGWLNGEQDYLFRRYDKCFREDRDAPTYYQGYLLPLFRGLSHRSAERPRNEQGEEEAIPFLNGGLFELLLSYGTANPPIDERLHVPNSALFDVFEGFLERYNFTTTEDTPLDVEVAVNPEVIGTIFETFVLTSEQEPETNAPDRRKATGSFYTPRIVVHFICRAVLRFYLAERTGMDQQVIKRLIEFAPAEQLTEEEERKLTELVSEQEATNLRQAALTLRACDPAVGSGAFPVGLLQEMVKLITLLDLRLHGRMQISRRNYAYDLKKRMIEECLYGVDIQEQAVQICELRLWLSLVVDYQVDERLPLRERIASIDALPNLTFRVRVGDSLLDQVFGRDWTWASEAGHEDVIDRIKEAKRLYFDTQLPEGKRELERQIVALQLRLMERFLMREASAVGANLPMLSGLTTRRQQAELERTRQRLDEIASLVRRCQEAQRELAAPARADDREDVRRFDAIRRELRTSFIWRLDFGEVFDGGGGFDIVFGNPPFVTARNPQMRERYRARWPTSCYKKYHMLAPFTELALTALLRPNGQFGYIMSNAFATRDFGKPLVEQVLQHLELRNVVDCSGLMFPGHGTPTCILLGHSIRSKPELPTLLCGTKPGMGQLHEEAEETELWAEIEAGWEVAGFEGRRVATAELDVSVARAHPWALNASGVGTKELMEEAAGPLRELLADDVGVATMTNSDEVFNNPPEFFRRVAPVPRRLRWYIEGDDVRDWSVLATQSVLAPYDDGGDVVQPQELGEAANAYLARFRCHLGSRVSFGSKTFDELGRPWYSFERWNAAKYRRPRLVCCGIATHLHCVQPDDAWATKQTVQVVPLPDFSDQTVLCSGLNSSAALFWLKQICFCKRESADAEADTYYEFFGNKLVKLPVSRALPRNTPVCRRAEALAQRCSDLGALIPGLHPRKLFEHPGEGYTDWYRQIRGYQPPHQCLNTGWQSAAELRDAWRWAVEEMRRLRRQMVALQEEMDWLMYGAYGLLTLDHPVVNLTGPEDPMPIEQMDRAYRLLQHERDIPADWPASQRALWQARLQAIAENEHVGRIEQPAYKRRWEEPFDDGDFLQAYEWWLREKAEWVLEHLHGGGPVELTAWATELRQDPRVRAAHEVALEIGSQRGDAAYIRERERGDFAAHLKRIIEEGAVPDDRAAFKKKHAKLRGIDPSRHLPSGVPRERFRSLTARSGWYKWAGQDIWSGVRGDVWDD